MQNENAKLTLNLSGSAVSAAVCCNNAEQARAHVKDTI
jgi:hypothetical protein